MKGTNTNQSGDQTPDAMLPDPDDTQAVSKSQLKRDSKALQDLGKKLSAMNAMQLSRVPLDSTLQDAILLSHRLANKRGALKRHFQYIGKLLRAIDAEPILSAVEAMEAEHANTVHGFRKLEQWRDRILQEGDPAIHEYCAQHAGADRQKIRQISRNHANAAEARKIRFARQLFKELRDSQ